MSRESISIEMIRRLVAFDTTSCKSNLELVAFVQAYLAEHGVESRLVHNESKTKANLFATIGPEERPGIMLSGHTDVVPVNRQGWNTDPFEVTEADGRLYGRGTCDMKSFIAVALSFVPEFLKRDLKTPIHLSLSYDEEVGCIGVRRLLAELEQIAVKPAVCIIGEPTEMKVILAHKGKLSLRCLVRGLECHSGLAHRGVNAVEAAAETVAYLKRMARRFRDRGPYDAEFDPPYTTVHTGLIRGGTALNIVPKECHFDFEFRHLPGIDPRALAAEVRTFAEETLLPEMRAVSREAGFTWEPLSQFPGLAIDEEAEVVRLAKALTGANATGKVSFGTEAGLFQEAGIPTVVCGPGNIADAHAPDEFVTVEQVSQCEAFMRRLVDRVHRA